MSITHFSMQGGSFTDGLLNIGNEAFYDTFPHNGYFFRGSEDKKIAEVSDENTTIKLT